MVMWQNKGREDEQRKKKKTGIKCSLGVRGGVYQSSSVSVCVSLCACVCVCACTCVVG